MFKKTCAVAVLAAFSFAAVTASADPPKRPRVARNAKKSTAADDASTPTPTSTSTSTSTSTPASTSTSTPTPTSTLAPLPAPPAPPIVVVVSAPAPAPAPAPADVDKSDAANKADARDYKLEAIAGQTDKGLGYDLALRFGRTYRNRFYLGSTVTFQSTTANDIVAGHATTDVGYEIPVGSDVRALPYLGAGLFMDANTQGKAPVAFSSVLSTGFQLVYEHPTVPILAGADVRVLYLGSPDDIVVSMSAVVGVHF